MICKHCKDQLTVDRGVLIDSTGGDVCGIASVADENPPNENMPHETFGFEEMAEAVRNALLLLESLGYTGGGFIHDDLKIALEELQELSQKGQRKVKRCHSKSN
jgi:hypothetical protein